MLTLKDYYEKINKKDINVKWSTFVFDQKGEITHEGVRHIHVLGISLTH